MPSAGDHRRMLIMGIRFEGGVCCRCGARVTDEGEHAASHFAPLRPVQRHVRVDAFQARLSELLLKRGAKDA